MRLTCTSFTPMMFLLFLTCAHGQDLAKESFNQIKFSPLKTFDPINPGLEISYERRYSQFSTQLTTAYLQDIFNTTEYYKGNFSGYRVGAEQKFFFLDMDRKAQPYCSFELVYARSRMDDIQTFTYKDNNNDRQTYKDTFSVHKNTFSFNCKFGLQIVVKHFVVETTIGVGIKRRNVTHEDRLQPNDYIDRSEWVIPTAKYFAVREGSYFTINVPFAVKLGVAF